MGDLAAVRLPRERSEWSQDFGINDYVGWLSALGYGYPFTTSMNKREEPIEGDFTGLVAGAYRSNPIVFSCLMKRFQLFSQARFQFQQLRSGQPGDYFGTADLSIIEQPEPGRGLPDLLSLSILDADLAGDWFGVRRPARVKRLRPDWTVIIVGSPNENIELPAWDPDTEIVGYSYMPGGPGGGAPWMNFEAGEVAHFAPIPDPMTRYRGMSILTAALREVRGDSASMTHKLAFFENAATPNLALKFPERMDPKKAEQAIEMFEQEHTGAYNAYRTIYLLGGAEIDVVGKDMKELEFAATQGKGETRIIAAMGLHPSIVPASEGMQGSALNTGEAQAARRLIADTTLTSLWTNMAQTLETIVPAPGGSRLWYDPRHVPFLAEDVKDAAEVIGTQVSAIRKLGDGGWIPDSAVDGVVSGDLRRLRHSGYLPVQVQPIQAAAEGGPAKSDDAQAPAAASSLLQLPGYATARAGLDDVLANHAPNGMVAMRTFWASSGQFEGETIEAGTWVPAGHQLARAFQSMFTPAETRPANRLPVASIAAVHANGRE